MAARHFWIPDLPLMSHEKRGLNKAFCGWNVARRNTTSDWQQVTCQLCLGRRDGLALKGLREANNERQQ